MRADRLLSILLLLQANTRLTAAELAKRLEVSERTIHRDMDALSAAGIPVVAERGTGGGWSLLGDYQTNLTGLTSEETLALFLPQPSQLLADLGLQHTTQSVHRKLLASLPRPFQQDAQNAANRLYIDTTGWHQTDREGITLIPMLLDAIRQERQLEITYRRSDTSVTRRLTPLGLVAKGSHWYLIGHLDDTVRTYKVARITAAERLDEPGTRPADFDLAAFWQASTAEFRNNLPQYPATLLVRTAALPRLKTLRFTRIHHQSEPDEDGWVKVEADFETDWHARDSILSLGSQAKVLAPQELRERVVRELEAGLELYK